MTALADRIDALLPQTQCTRCGYPACRPYAEAIEQGKAEINRCPPGGEALIRGLGALLGRAYVPLDPACGVESPRRVARIDEPRCIGCTLCIQACPVDAIVGAAKLMHTVVTGLCTGCELCLPPCPVDCIDMIPATGDGATWSRSQADAARKRFEARQARVGREAESAAARHARRTTADADTEKKRATIRAAVERARARRARASIR